MGKKIFDLEKEISDSDKQSSRIYFEQGENYNIPKESEVTLIDYGNKIEVKHSWRKPDNLKRYIKKDKYNYIDTKTGEIKPYKKSKKIYKTSKEINKRMEELRQLILYNFQGNKNELFITLTCRDNVIDIKDIKKYTSYFMKRLKRKYKPKKKFEYIYKFERMENDKWHVHILLKDIKNKTLFIPNDEIEKLWKRGITKTQRIYEGD